MSRVGESMLSGALLLEGIPASAGLAYGPLHVLDAARPATGVERPDPCAAPLITDGVTAAEAERHLGRAITAASAQLTKLRRITRQPDARAILDFQCALLEDETLARPAFERIAAGEDGEAAWRWALGLQIDAYATADDEYFRARTADFCDVRDRVVRALRGTSLATVPDGSIVVTDDMAPSRFVELRWEGGGLALFGGSANSHVATLARAQGVPMIVRLTPGALGRHEHALIDGQKGAFIASPDEATVREFGQWRHAALAQRGRDREYLAAPAVTADGERISVQLNVADRSELDGLSPAHCDGIGLVRTELSLTTLAALLDEDAQFEHYAQIVRWAQGRPVTFRTVDAGGDKPVSGYTLPDESNAFLGLRGLRLSLRNPTVLLTQLRALARAAALGPVKVMVPMVTRPFELERARVLFDRSLAAVRAAGVVFETPQLGMMVEVPAAALTLDLFSADFFSIGSNDLIAYLTATSRDSSQLDALTDPIQPAVLRIIAEIVRQARRRDLEVSLCGDMASDERYLPMLVTAGVRTFSVAPAALAGVKAALARLAHARG